MKRILFLAILSSAIFSFAQTPPSANSLGLVREASVPVDLYTGIPQITVPLYTLPHHGGLSVPVFLSYHAGGHKVQDAAGPIGLGWTLNAGGMITRVVRGLPDGGLGPLNPTSAQDYQDISEGNQDGEFDMFYLSLPGRSLKFIYDEVNNSGGYTIPKSNLDIQFEWEFYPGGGGSRVWTVTDEQGNKYFFGNHTANANAEEVTTSNTMENGEYISGNDRTYVSTWYLVKIDYYNSAHDVTFSYIPGSVYSYEHYNNIMEINWSQAAGYNSVILDDYEVTATNTKVTINPKYVSTISSLKGSVKFGWTSGRSDIGDRRLTSVSLHKPGATNAIDYYDLSQVYLDSYKAPFTYTNTNAYPYGHTATTHVVPSGYIDGSSKNRYRLQLSSISKNGYMYRSFNYFGDGEDDTNQWNETYNYNFLPPRDGLGVDFLGYSNGGILGFGGNLIADVRFPEIDLYGGVVSKLIEGFSRDPNVLTSKAHVLKQILFPSGGFQSFEFEQNMHGSNQVPGIRIKSISSNNGSEEITKINYTYEDSHVYNKASYTMSFWDNDGDVFITSGVSVQDNAITLVNSHSTTQLLDLNGSYITYGKVTEAREGFGKTEYTFFDYDDYPDVIPEYDVEGIDISISTYNGPPFTPNTSLAWTRGMPKSRSSFVLEDGVYRKQTEEVYDYYSVNDFTPQFAWTNTRVYYLTRYKEVHIATQIANKLFGWISPIGSISRDDIHIVGKYKSINEPLIPKSFTSKIFDKNDATKFTETVTEFNYDGSNEMIFTSTTQTNADGSQNKTEVTNVVDIAPTSQPSSPSSEVDALWKMRQDNLLGHPVEIIHLFKETSSWSILSGQYTEYDKYSTPSSARPFKIFGFTSSEPILEGNFNKVSSTGSTVSKDLRYEPFSELTYGNDGSVSRLYNNLTGQYTDYEYDANGYLEKIEYDPLNDPNRKTTYSTIPLIGIQSETDMNSRSVSYEYDSRNRLHLVRDSDNNIVERYRYNNSNESNELTAGPLTISGSNIKDTPQTVSLGTIKGYGNTEVRWLDSNNNLLSTNASFNHTFSGTGTKTLKLALINPESDAPANLTVSKTFYNEWSVGAIAGSSTICSNGSIAGPLEEEETIPLEGEDYSVFVTSGGTTCGVLSGNYSYQWQHNKYGNWQNFGTNSFTVELPSHLRTINDQFDIHVIVTSNCGQITSASKTITVETCTPGGGGGGGGSGSWSPYISPTVSEICAGEEPSEAELQASISGTFTCTGLNYTYSWSIKTSTGSYQPLLGSSNQITITRAMLQNINPSLYGIYNVRVIVTDNCSGSSTSKESVVTLQVPLQCGGGLGGPGDQ